jgi:hypothetical protein
MLRSASAKVCAGEKWSPIVNARGIARLGMLAVGLGIAAVASTPGIASADTPADPVSFSSINLGDLFPAADAAPSSALDLDISVDGHTLLELGTGATATSGTGDVAIAFGSGGTATAEGGFGDVALADSTGSGGANTNAVAGDQFPGATGNNFDFATATGNNSHGAAGNVLSPTETTGSSFDFASASGGSGGDPDIAVAGDNGSGDIANAVGQGVVSLSGVSNDAPANFDFASAIGNLTTATTTPIEAFAGGGGNTAGAIGGSNDTAFVIDPLGTVGSTAFAGLGNNFDLAGVFGDDLNASATGANFLVDILPSL